MFIFIEICMKGDPLVRIKGKQPMKSVLEVGNVQMVGGSLQIRKKFYSNYFVLSVAPAWNVHHFARCKRSNSY
jgi:hypothetical protein